MPEPTQNFAALVGVAVKRVDYVPDHGDPDAGYVMIDFADGATLYADAPTLYPPPAAAKPGPNAATLCRRCEKRHVASCTGGYCLPCYEEVNR